MDKLLIENEQIKVLDFATDKRLYWENNHFLYSVIFELTPKCNFNCVHCYLHNHHNLVELNYDEIIQIIDILYNNEVLFLTFTGGEIFTRKDFIDIYLYAKKKGFIVELYTNGALINAAIIDTLKKYPPLLVDISLYGSCEDTYQKVTGVSGMFDKIIHNISELISAGIRVSLKAPVLNLYYAELTKIKRIAQSFRIPFRTGFEIFPSIDNDKSIQKYSVSLKDSLKYEFQEFALSPRTFGNEPDVELINLIQERPLFRCKLGRASCAIDYQGKMCPCMSFRHVGKKLTKDNFNDIWQSFSLYPKIKASLDYKCLKCEAYDFCDICPAMMQFVYGDLEYVDEHFCKSAKARYMHYIDGVSVEDVLKQLDTI